MPPSPVVSVFEPWNEKADIVPKEPAQRSRQREPAASAASSMRTMSWREAISEILSQFGIAP